MIRPVLRAERSSLLLVNEAQYALVGVFFGAAIPALASIWQGRQAGRQAGREREAASAQRRADHRLSLIASWRDGLSAVIAESPGSAHPVQLGGGQNSQLHSQSWYLSLLPHLTPEARKRVEPGPGIISMSFPGSAPVMFALAEEIARIEREWDLA